MKIENHWGKIKNEILFHETGEWKMLKILDLAYEHLNLIDSFLKENYSYTAPKGNKVAFIICMNLKIYFYKSLDFQFDFDPENLSIRGFKFLLSFIEDLSAFLNKDIILFDECDFEDTLLSYRDSKFYFYSNQEVCQFNANYF